MKTAVVYARYSSEKQTEQSIEGQLRVCQEFAAKNDIKIVDTYIDRATTGTNDNRAAFQKMLSDSEKNPIWHSASCVISFFTAFSSSTLNFLAEFNRIILG